MDVEDLTPTFDVDLYKDSLLTPIFGWGILQFLWFIFSLMDGDANSVSGTGAYGFGSAFSSSTSSGGGGLSFSFALIAPSPEIVLLFGAWAGMSLARNGSNTGDSIIGGIITGLAAWILWFFFFALLDPADIEPDFGEFSWPMLLSFILYHIAGSMTIVGIVSDPKNRPARPKKEKKVKEKKEKKEKKETKAADASSDDDSTTKKSSKKSTKKTTKKSTKSDE